MSTDATDLSYINSTDYTTLSTKIKQLSTTLDDLTELSFESRQIRYADIDVKGQRNQGVLQPDELYLPLHIIDTNVRREQSSYVQYITQSPRAVILEDVMDAAIDLSLLEKDLTKKLRFPGWQMSSYANIDSFQANGYSIMETVQDIDNPGQIGRESVQFGDFAFTSDTRDLQSVEFTARQYFYTRTRLVSLCGSVDNPLDSDWSRDQVDKVITASPDDGLVPNMGKDTSLYRVIKVMFRVEGEVQVAWACPSKCDGWLRKPRPLFVGRRKLVETPEFMQANMMQMGKLKLEDFALQQLAQGQTPASEEMFETEYPYFLYPYLISENDTISQLKGRVFLDQDTQEAASSLLSSLVTKARRSAGLYGSRDVSDPNSDILEQKNIYLKSGCILNSKVSFTELKGPDASLFTAVNTIVSMNQNETSQVNFAETNRQNDSRKTATAVQASMQMAQQLSTVQVVLFSIANKNQFTYEVDIIKSRVIAGLIKVSLNLLPLYARKFTVKPSGDVDVIEKQQLIQSMLQTAVLYQGTAAWPQFLADLTELMYPTNAPKYNQAIAQQLQQTQGAQAQQQQQVMQMVMQMGEGIVSLSKKPEMFSETGKIHALPILEMAAEKLEQMKEQMAKGGTQ